MTGLRTAAQQALEAWDQPHGINYVDFRPYMNALRAALAEPVQEPVAWIHTDPEKGRVKFLEWRENEPGYRGDWIKTPLYAAPPQRPAEPVQEPPEFPPHDDKVHAGAVYWYVGTDGKYYSSNEVKLFMETKNKSLHYEPPKWVLDNFDLIPLYTAPPQRKPLTEEEILSLFRTAGSPVLFARAIERAHGITP